MFSICKQTHPATGVEHSTSCYFFNKSEKNLVIACTNIIKVFRLIPDVDLKSKLEHYTALRPPKMKLECLSQYTLHGNIMSLQWVSLANSERDALLLGFKDAKLSVVQYDPDYDDLKTLSLHYFEEDDMKEGWTHHFHIPMVRVDPENRCAVMTVFGRKLVVLPFRKETNMEEIMADGMKKEQNKKFFSKIGGHQNVHRSPIMASYTIVLKDLDEKIDNVLDIEFLYGYYEPTLLILYEPVKTFPGRIAVRSDTCCMAAISLNIAQKVHPIIWTVANLPFDCIRAVPVRKPLGGTLIMAVNSLIYLNQSVPPYGVALNSIADHSTSFPLKPQDNLKITLDCSQVAFIDDDKLVISLKGGELYVLTLFVDSMRSIRSFHFDKAAASVLTTCICVCGENYLFLGSRLGNSLLLRFTEKENFQVITIDDKPIEESETTRKNKRQKLNEVINVYDEDEIMPSDVLDIRDQDELEVYGNEKQTSVQITSFIFEVCDSLLNIGPCGQVSMGKPSFISREFSSNYEADDQEYVSDSTDGAEISRDTKKSRYFDIELVTTSGHAKNGALCVIQKSVRPQVITTFELPGCIDMWTVYGDGTSQATSDSDEDKHSFLILSQEDSTMILQTGNEINEIENSGFFTAGPTIFATNIGKRKYIVQVTETAVRLLYGAKQIQHLPLDLGSPIVHATSVDPYLSLLSEDGQVINLTLRETRGVAKLVITKSTVPLSPSIVTICLYCDVSGLFSNKSFEDLPEPNLNKMSSFDQPSSHHSGVKAEKQAEKVEKWVSYDNEDDLLYGENSAFDIPTTLKQQAAAPLKKRYSLWWKKYLVDVKPTFWLFVLRVNNNLEIYSIPEFRLCYLIQNITYGHKVLIDSLESVPEPLFTSYYESQNRVQQNVKEISMISLGNHGSRPILLIRLENELFIYQAFHYAKGGHLLIRFRRLPHDIMISNRLCQTEPKYDNTKLRYFSNIAGYNGVFLCGIKPYWIFLTYRGELRTHPMWIDGETTCFAAFNNVNCAQGFLYYNKKMALRICQLTQHVTYDAPWPVRKVPLRHSVLHIAYHNESHTYALAACQYEETKKYYRFNGEDKELTELPDKGERFPYPQLAKFQIYLFSPATWQQIPNTVMDMDEWEHVTCLKTVYLSYEGTMSGLRGYIAVGTNYNYGEDITSRGRILIYDIIEVVPEPGQPLTKNRFKTIYAKDQKGPVTALSQVLGFLVSAVGQKIYIWQLKDNDLVGVAFIDTQIYIHQITSIKGLILVADVYKSISLLRFQDEFRTLSLVSRDFRPCEVYTMEFLIDNTNLGFLVSDSERNMVLYMYQPEQLESYGGQKLIRKGDYHVGQLINTLFRVKCRRTTKDKAITYGQQILSDRKHVTMFATLDGGLGYILPLSEKTYRRLLMLQNVLILQGPHAAGLNPKAYRTYKSRTKLLSNPARSILDGDLVFKFLYLSLPEKQEISKKIGTKIEEIIEDLVEINELTQVF